VPDDPVSFTASLMKTIIMVSAGSYQLLIVGRNENYGRPKRFHGLRPWGCKPISSQPRIVGFLLEVPIT
jgi:hypothetical protein